MIEVEVGQGSFVDIDKDVGRRWHGGCDGKKRPWSLLGVCGGRYGKTCALDVEIDSWSMSFEVEA